MHDIKKLLEKYIAGKCTPEEQLFIEQWYHQESDRSNPDTSALNFEQLETTIWQQVQQQIAPRPKRVKLLRHTGFKIAASFLVLLGAGILMWLLWPDKEKWQEVFATKGEPLQLILDDGTKVWLNAGSGMRYPAHFTGSTRQIELLSGEICLDVQQDHKRPFILKSGPVNTRVLGTVFNVRAYPQLAFLQITVQQGKVAVQGSQDLQQLAGKAVIVLPDEQLTIYTGSKEISKTKVDGSAINGWTTGKLLFNNERLDVIALLLENKYNKQLSFADTTLPAYRVTLGIETTDSLPDILEALCLANKLTYTTQGQHIIFRKQTH